MAESRKQNARSFQPVIRQTQTENKNYKTSNRIKTDK